MRFMRQICCAEIFALLLLVPSVALRGQAVRLLPNRPLPRDSGSLSVSVTPTQVNFNLVARGTAVGSTSVNITTTWTSVTLGSSITLYGYFTSSSAALTGSNSGANIPSSAVFGEMTTGLPTSYTAFTQTCPFGVAGASLQLFSETVTGSDTGNRTDALSLMLDLSSLRELPADTYTGTLIIEAQGI